MTMQVMHSLLRLQLRRAFGGEDEIPESLHELLNIIDCTYLEFDTHRTMLERSVDLSSQGLLKAYSEISAILRAFPDIFLRVDSAGIIMDCQGGADAEFFFPLDKSIGRRMSEIPDDDSRSLMDEALKQTLEAGEPTAVEYAIVRNGTTYHEARFIPVDAREVILVVRNVTRERMAGRDLDIQRAFLRQVIDANPHFIFAKDRRGCFTLVNRAVADAYGTTVEKLLGKSDSDFNPDPEEVEHFRNDDLEVIDGGREKNIPLEKITDAAGNTRWLWTIKRPIQSPDGLDTHVLGVATDITQRLRAETNLRERNLAILRNQEALHQLALMDHGDMEAMLKTIILTAADVLGCRRVGIRIYDEKRAALTCRCLVDAGGVIPSETALRKTDYPLYFETLKESRSMAVTDAWTDPRTSEFRDSYLGAAGITSMMDVPVWLSGDMIGVVFFEHVGPAREWMPEEMSFATSIADFVSLALGTVKRQQLERELRQSQKMEAIGHLAGGVAHDFNNILTAINGEAQLLLRAGGLSEKAVERVTQILSSGERAANLTRQLLMFSRRETTAPKIVDMNEIIHDLAPMLNRVVGEDITFDFVLSPDPALVKVDPGHVEQVLMNLVVNSRDAMPAGGRITIETGILPADPAEPLHVRAFITVADTGIGMNEEIQARVFEPFFTTKDAGRGTGLGLSTVYGIIQQNRGSIEVTSAPGQGTTFTIQLPAEMSHPKAEDRHPRCEQASRGRETILVVEDENRVLSFVKEVLELQGYSILAAGGPEEAIRLSDRYPGRIHLLLTDVVMPGMNGCDLYDRLRNSRPGMDVLYMSGYTEGLLDQHSRFEPIQDLVQKPFSFEELSNRVRSALDRREKPFASESRVA